MTTLTHETVAAGETVRQRPRRRAGSHLGRPGAVWALPGLMFFTVFAIFPMVVVAYLSFTSWDGLTSPRLIGLGNWNTLFHDSSIISATAVTLVLLAGNMLFQTPISILLGVWAAGQQRNRAVLSAIFFVPLLLSTAATAVMWRQLLDPNFGLPSKLPWLFGGDGNFIGTRNGAIIAIVAVTTWQFVPFHSLLYQGAARAVPRSLYEAAAIDGASTIRQFFAITLPQLRNTAVTSITFMIVGGLTAFDIVLVLTGGGPGTDTSIVPFRMYQEGFQNYNFGYASTIAILLLAIATAVSFVLVRISGYSRMESTLEGM